jgi:predicted nucleotidyltransferase
MAIHASGAGTAAAVAAALERDAGGTVVSAYLFGSQAEGRAHRESDVDLGVLFRHDRLPTARERFEARLRLDGALCAALSRPVDLVVLNDAPPLFARRIIYSRRVFCADHERDHAFRRDTQLRAADIEPFLRRTGQLKLEALGR